MAIVRAMPEPRPEETGEPPAADRLAIRSEALSLRRVRVDAWRGRILLVLLWGAGFAITAWLKEPVACLGPPLLLAGTAALIGRHHGAPVVGVRARGARGTLWIDAAGVEVEIGGRRHRFARAEIVGGWAESFRDREEVVLAMRGGTLIRAAVDGAPQARAVLRAAGVAPEQRAVSLRLGAAETGGMRAVLVFLTMLLAPFSALLIAGALGLALDRQGEGAAVCGFFAALAVAALVILARPLVTTTLRIGTDGVIVQRLWRRRFLPRAALASVTTDEDRVVLRRREGPLVVLRTSGRIEAATVVQRIRDAIAGPRDATPEAAALSRLDRHGRSVREWLRQVRLLGAEHGGYRDAALDRRALLDVVEDGRAPAERRIAAAAALVTTENAVRRRVKAAAETCADPRLGAALEAASAGELEEAQIEEAVRAAKESR